MNDSVSIEYTTWIGSNAIINPPIIGPTILRILITAEFMVIAFGNRSLGSKLGNIDVFETLPNESRNERIAAKHKRSRGDAKPIITDIVKINVTSASSPLLMPSTNRRSTRSVTTPAICVPNSMGKNPIKPSTPSRYLDPVMSYSCQAIATLVISLPTPDMKIPKIIFLYALTWSAGKRENIV